MKVWVGGELLEEDDVRVSPFDHGLLTGDGVFETVRAYAGELFAWTRHLERLTASASAMGLAVPDGRELRDAAVAVLEANKLGDARVRVTLTGGRAPLGSAKGTGPPACIVAAAPLEPPAATIDVAAVPWPRNERGALTGVKSISYGENVRAYAYAAERGAGEAVFANTRGDLCEATGSNVFLVEVGTVVTPPLSAGCLAGVTRALVIELCRANRIPVDESDRPVTALADADEAFLTSTTREVQAISAVDGESLRSAPGPLTARIASLFRDLVASNPDP